MKMTAYLDRLTEQIRSAQAREPIREEIKNHIEDQRAAYMEEGMSESEAEAQAVLDMGDPVAVGGELDRIHRPKMAWGAAALIVGLALTGILLRYVVHSRMGGGEDLAYRYGRELVFLVFGAAVMLAVCRADYSRIARISKALYLLLVAGLAAGAWRVNGGVRWISVFSIQISAVLAAFLLVPLYGAELYGWRGSGYGVLPKAFLWMVPGIGIMAACRSVYGLAAVAVSFLTALTVAIWKGWFRVSKIVSLWIVWGSAAAAAALSIRYVMREGSAYAAMRARAFLDFSGEDTVITHAVREVLRESRWIGAGKPFTELDRALFPDYLLTYLIGCFGLLAGICFVLVIAGLIFWFFRLSLRQKNQLGMIMGTACSTVLLMEFALYLASNLGLYNIGAYCPFLVYGGSGMVVNFALFGILLSIFRYENVLIRTEPGFPAGARQVKYGPAVKVVNGILALGVIAMIGEGVDQYRIRYDGGRGEDAVRFAWERIEAEKQVDQMQRRGSACQWDDNGTTFLVSLTYVDDRGKEQNFGYELSWLGGGEYAVLDQGEDVGGTLLEEET